MYLNQLLESAKLMDTVQDGGDIILMDSDSIAGVDSAMVVSKEDFDKVFVSNRAIEPASEVVMSLLADKKRQAPYRVVIGKHTSLVSAYNKLQTIETTSKLEELTTAEDCPELSDNKEQVVPYSTTVSEETEVNSHNIDTLADLLAGGSIPEEVKPAVSNSASEFVKDIENSAEESPISQTEVVRGVLAMPEDEDFTQSPRAIRPTMFATMIPDDDLDVLPEPSVQETVGQVNEDMFEVPSEDSDSSEVVEITQEDTADSNENVFESEEQNEECETRETKEEEHENLDDIAEPGTEEKSGESDLCTESRNNVHTETVNRVTSIAEFCKTVLFDIVEVLKEHSMDVVLADNSCSWEELTNVIIDPDSSEDLGVVIQHKLSLLQLLREGAYSEQLIPVQRQLEDIELLDDAKSINVVYEYLAKLIYEEE